MNIVKFKDGTYGIRRFSFKYFYYEYKELNLYSTYNTPFWWDKNSFHFMKSKGPKQLVYHTWCQLNNKSIKQKIFEKIKSRRALIKNFITEKRISIKQLIKEIENEKNNP